LLRLEKLKQLIRLKDVVNKTVIGTDSKPMPFSLLASQLFKHPRRLQMPETGKLDHVLGL
jgi:hypothetical protein